MMKERDILDHRKRVAAQQKSAVDGVLFHYRPFPLLQAFAFFQEIRLVSFSMTGVFMKEESADRNVRRT